MYILSILKFFHLIKTKDGGVTDQVSGKRQISYLSINNFKAYWNICFMVYLFVSTILLR